MAARPGSVARWPYSAARFALAISVLLLPSVAARAQEASPRAAALLADAERHYAAGNHDEVIEQLRTLRLRHPAAPELPHALLLAGRSAVALDNGYQARYLLGRALEATVDLELTLEAATLLATLLAEQRDFCAALTHLEQAIAAAARLPRPDQAAALHLRASSTSLRHIPSGGCAAASALGLHDLPAKERAVWHYDRVRADALAAAERAVHKELARSLMWTLLPAQSLGLVDGSVSALATDRDDLWVGTWNGGLARYATPSRRVLPFDEGGAAMAPLSVRSITATNRHVFVGTLQGLNVYSKASGRWRELPPFGDATTADRISAVVASGDELYVATLGRGLWRGKIPAVLQGDGGAWNDVAAVGTGLPGAHLNALLLHGGRLWIGSQDIGLVTLDLETQQLATFDQINPRIGPRNVTDVVAGHAGELWVTTFGEGLFRWRSRTNRVTHYTAANGNIPDDWVMSGIRTPSAMYFGTFGGGVARFDEEAGRWSRIGLPEGLPSLDVAVVAYAEGVLYFGTLGAGVAALSERRGRPVLAALGDAR